MKRGRPSEGHRRGCQLRQCDQIRAEAAPRPSPSLRLIREIHGRLLQGVRGSERTPGEFRRTQNWIGPAGCNLHTATFIPPPVDAMNPSLDNLERFLHDTDSFPVLIHCSAHAQFETIHPFIDGNGRVGRLLITFLLCQREILQQPLLYLSSYLKARRAEYYDRLMAIPCFGRLGRLDQVLPSRCFRGQPSGDGNRSKDP